MHSRKKKISVEQPELNVTSFFFNVRNIYKINLLIRVRTFLTAIVLALRIAETYRNFTFHEIYFRYIVCSFARTPKKNKLRTYRRFSNSEAYSLIQIMYLINAFSFRFNYSYFSLCESIRERYDASHY